MIKEIDFKNEVFNSRSKEFNIADDATTELLADLRDTLNANEIGFLTANEIGRTERAFAIKFEDGIKVYCNPVFQDKKEPKLVREIDEVTGKDFIMPRFKDVTICFQSETGEVMANQFKDTAALIVCKAMDFIDGIHDSDFGLEVLPEFDEATDEERAEVINAYIEYLTNLEKQLDAELMLDEDSKDEWTSYKFMKAKAEGNVETWKDEPKLNRKQRRLLSKLKKKLLKVEVNND